MRNLIKIEGIYNAPARFEKFNIFCNILINFNDFNNIKISVKTRQVDKDDLVYFDENNFIMNNDEIIKNTLNIITNLKNNGLEGEIDAYLQNLTNFLFQYIYNEYYMRGSLIFNIFKLTFDIIRMA